MPTVAQVMDALAGQIQSQLSGTADPVIENLQVDGRMIPWPTPPAIDVYPGTPFTEQIAFGPFSREYNFTVRARVSTADHEAGQDLLLAMMDEDSPESLADAILADKMLGGVGAQVKRVDGPTQFALFVEPGVPAGEAGSLLGATWTVLVIKD